MCTKDGTADTNTLYYGDNLSILRELPSESVDLIYLDPPFNSKANYNVFFGQDKDKAQNEAFKDTWTWSEESKTLYNSLIANKEGRQTEDTIKTLQGLYHMLGACGMFSYILYMQARLVEMRRLLIPKGSLYLHGDPTASHYLKIVLDSIFGAQHFRNEIIWHYNSGARGEYFGKRHDIIFWYSKTDTYVFNKDAVRTPYSKDINIPESKKHYYHPAGKVADDVWRINIIAQNDKTERLGYPTQKPLALLERIVKASSKVGDVVLDPFCGCGTTLDAAQALKRRWIGIDISYLAIDTIQSRFKDRYDKQIGNSFAIKGIPKDMEGAEKLLTSTLGKAFDQDPKTLAEACAFAKRKGKPGEKHGKNAGRFEFQRWVCSLVDAVPNDREIGDGGVDGKLRFLKVVSHKEVVDVYGAVQVKSSEQSIKPADVRALKGVLSNGSNYVMGILISLYKSDSAEMRRICSDFAEPQWTHYSGKRYSGQPFPKLQVFSIEEYFDSRKPHMPTAIKPYRKAEKERMNVVQEAF